MKRCLVIILLFAVTGPWAAPAFAQNPFTAKPEVRHKAVPPAIKGRFFVKLITWQYHIKQKMAELIRDVQVTGNPMPLLLLVALAFSYGAIHAAGPGHGKFVAMSYMLSHKSSVMGGLLFGMLTAFLHGFSGAVGVLGLRYLFQRGVGETLGSVTTATQIISFGLITLLGLGIFLKNGYALFPKSPPRPHVQETKVSRKGLVPWALAVGLVPCPAVVMVMLFCLSMDALTLGLVLAVFISLGMALTISTAVIAVLVGKVGALQIASGKRVEMIEHGVGLVSGMAVTIFGAIFFIAAVG
jgi:ABC-type nickel/cobalt efflux system permease component RcnA